MEEKRLTLKNYLGYAITDLGNSLAFSAIGSYLSRFYTNLLMIGNWSSVILIVARIWDGINDPIMGFIAQSKKPSKNGKYRPFLLKGGIPLALSAFLVFCKIPGLSVTGYIIFAFISYIAYGMLYTVLLVPYGSLASVMTTKENERSMLSVCRSIGGGIGSVPGGIIFPMFVFTTANGVSEMDPTRLMIVMGAFSVLMMVMYTVGYGTVKENVPSPENPPKIDVLRTFKSLLGDRVFVIMGVIGCLLIASNMYSGTVTTYLFPDYFGKTGMMMVYYVCTYAPLIITMPFVNAIIKKFGKKEFMTAGLVISTVTCLIMWLSHTENIWVYIAFNFIINAGVGFLTLEIWALALDIVDHQEYVTGRREEASTYASFTFLRKIGQAIAGIVPTLILSIGYDTSATVQSEAVLSKLYTVSTFVPFLLYAAMLILMILYPLNKKKMDEMHSSLEKTRNEQKALNYEQT